MPALVVASHPAVLGCLDSLLGPGVPRMHLRQDADLPAVVDWVHTRALAMEGRAAPARVLFALAPLAVAHGLFRRVSACVCVGEDRAVKAFVQACAQADLTHDLALSWVVV